MIDAFITAVGTIADETRHALLSGWFGRHFEPHPTQQRSDPGELDHDHDQDPLGRTRDVGIER